LRESGRTKFSGATPIVLRSPDAVVVDPERLLLAMIFVQAGMCALIGTGVGLGICAIAAQLLSGSDYPFRMMWFTPVVGCLMVLLVSVVSAAISAWPVLKLEPGIVFAGR
jgi:putative ABC transport system permease protein